MLLEMELKPIASKCSSSWRDLNFSYCCWIATSPLANSLRKKCLLLLLEMQLHPLPETAAIPEENFYCSWDCNFTHCLKQ